MLAVVSNMLDTATIVRNGFRTLNQVVGPLVEAGLGNPLPFGVGPVMVHTTGRKSGLLRKVPLLSARIGDTVFVSTVRPASQWMANLSTTPAATVTLFGRERAAETSFGTVGPLRVAALHLQQN